MFLVARFCFVLVKMGTRLLPIFSSVEYNYYRNEPKKNQKKKKEKEKKRYLYPCAVRFDVYNFHVAYLLLSAWIFLNDDNQYAPNLSF